MTAARTIRRPRTAPRVLLLGAALGLALTGCSGDGGGGGGGDGDGDGDSDSGRDEPAMGAIDKLFQEAYGEYDEERANAEQMRIEELTSQCMTEQGFEYIPVDYSSQTGAMMEIDDEIPWGTLEFAEQWGYGITTNPYQEAEEEAPEPLPTEEWVDPNADYVNAMSETEQTAYYAALYGDMSSEPIDSEGEYVQPSWEEMGCSGYAQHEVYGDSAFGGSDEFQGLMDEMNRMWETVSNDERLTEVGADWAACMADAGFPNMLKVGDGEQEISQRADPIWNDAYEDMPPDATEEDYRAVEDEIQRQLGEITPDEIKIAVADYTCREDVGYDDVMEEVNLDAQQRFYDEHKDELERWVESESNRGVG